VASSVPPSVAIRRVRARLGVATMHGALTSNFLGPEACALQPARSMPNERDDWRNRHRGRGRDDRGRDERGDYGRFAPDEDRGGRGRSVWGGEDRDRGRMNRDEDLRSVGSPGIGGGTGGSWDQAAWDRDRGGDELRYRRGGGMAGDDDVGWSPGQSGVEASRPRGEHKGKGPMNYQRSDTRIREDVCDYLTDDDEVDASEIEVKVEACEVTLTGTVPSRDMKRRAEQVAERAAGVRDVHNQLKVQDRERQAERGDDGAAGAGRNRGARA
jgi:osmotically-inducible protein OsmY